MTPLRNVVVATVCLAISALTSLHADVKTEERTKFELGGILGKVVNIFGGKDAREGTMTTVALKGSRKSMFNDATGQIIDLAEEKIYDLDVKRKTYRVMTFAELRQRMEEAKAKAEKAAREEQAKQKAEPAPASRPEDSVEIDLDVKSTGQKRAINGFNTSQVVVTVAVREKGKTLEQSGGLAITTDMWMAPRMPAMKELMDFEIAIRAEAVRADDRRRVTAGHGQRHGNLSHAEARARKDERRTVESRGHRHFDDPESRGGQVG